MPLTPVAIVSSWKRVLAFYRAGGADRWSGWMFRGQTRASWPLESSLEREAVRRFGIQRRDLYALEGKMLRDFQRQAHHYRPDTPDPDDRLGWLALMQHFGAPTRLVDWTYSFYAAVYFAIAEAKPGQTCSVFAIDFRWCRQAIARAAKADATGTPVPRRMEELLFRKPRTAGLYPVNPFRLHERLVVQQGVFLAPGDLQLTYLGNYRSMKPPAQAPLIRVNIVVTRKLLADALRDLRRMNVTAASLFPGFDGFARHMSNMIPVLHKLPVDEPPV